MAIYSGFSIIFPLKMVIFHGKMLVHQRVAEFCRKHPLGPIRSSLPQRPINAIGVRLAAGTHQAGFAGSRTWKKRMNQGRLRGFCHGNLGHFTRNLGCVFLHLFLDQNGMDLQVISVISPCLLGSLTCLTNCWLGRGCFR